MLKIALDFVDNKTKEDVKTNLIKRNFEVSEGSFGTLWVYDLEHVDYSKNNIELVQKYGMKFVVVLLEDLDYFEVWEEK